MKPAPGLKKCQTKCQKLAWLLALLYGESNLMSIIYVWNTIFVDMVAAAMNNTRWATHKDENKFVGYEKQGLEW